jgi:hypothetical protein
MKNKILINALVFFLLPVVSTVHAEMATGVGEYLYGPETSKAEACRMALDKARSMALSSVMGESVSNEQQMYCNESSGKKADVDCEYHSMTWSLIDGDIKPPRKLEQKIEERYGETACIVAIEAEVIPPAKKPDPNFEVKLKINQTVFRAGDDFNLEFESTMPSYFAIFNWLPNENNQIHRVPTSNSVDRSDSDELKKNVNGKFLFSQSYTATWSKAYKGDKKFYDEWVLVVVTKKPFKWLSSYDFETFKEKLREIPNDERRIKRLGYQLFK